MRAWCWAWKLGERAIAVVGAAGGVYCSLLSEQTQKKHHELGTGGRRLISNSRSFSEGARSLALLVPMASLGPSVLHKGGGDATSRWTLRARKREPRREKSQGLESL